MNTIHNHYSPILPHIGKIIGAACIQTPVIHEKRDFECAAWHETHTSETGVFPITLEIATYGKSNEVRAIAHIPAKVTSDDFTSYFGGNPIAGAHKATHVGASREIQKAADIVDAITHASSTLSAGYNTSIVFREFAEDFVAYYKHQLKGARASYDTFARLYDTTGEDEFCSRVGMVAWCGERIAEYARAAEEIQRCIIAAAERAKWASDDYYDINTGWANPIRLAAGIAPVKGGK